MVNTEAVAGLLPITLIALSALIAGYALGRQHSRRVRRELQRSLSALNIELLEARGEQTRLAARLAQEPRRERLLRVVLARLHESRRRERALFIGKARLRLAAAVSARRARRAARLARLAAARVRELEEAAIATGTITIRGAKSHGAGEPVTVSVVDHETRASRLDGMVRLPQGERARLARLAPSNQPREFECIGLDAAHTLDTAHARTNGPTRGTGSRCPEPTERDIGDLGLIDGLATADAHRLNALGIHDLEQLAALSDHEQRALHGRIVEMVGPGALGTWIGSARALLERQPTA